MEKEICKRETTKKVSTIFNVIAWIFVGFGALCLLTVLFVSIVDDGWDYLFIDGSYLIPMFLGLGLGVVSLLFFAIESKVSDATTSLVLTNKRIYTHTVTPKINLIESYNLRAITYYNFCQTQNKNNKYFTLVFKTATNTARYVVDEAFFNKFVDTLNATIG